MGRKALFQIGEKLVANPVSEVAAILVRAILAPRQSADFCELPQDASFEPEERAVKAQAAVHFGFPHSPPMGACAAQQLQEKRFHLVASVMGQGKIAAWHRAGSALEKVVPPSPRHRFRTWPIRGGLFFQESQPVGVGKPPDEGRVLSALWTPPMIQVKNNRPLPGQNQRIEEYAGVEPSRNRGQNPDGKLCYGGANHFENGRARTSRVHGL